MKADRLWIFGLLMASVSALGPSPLWITIAFVGAMLAFLMGFGRRRLELSGTAVLLLVAFASVEFVIVGIVWSRSDPAMPMAHWTAAYLIGLAMVALAGFRRSPVAAPGILYLVSVSLFALAAGPIESPWVLPSLIVAVPLALGAFLSQSFRRAGDPTIRSALIHGAIVVAVAVPLFLIHPIPFGAVRTLTEKFIDSSAPAPGPGGDGARLILLRTMPLEGIRPRKQDETPLMIVQITQGLEHLPRSGPRQDRPTLYLRGGTMDTYRNGFWSSRFRMGDPSLGVDGWLSIAPVADTGTELAGEVILTEGVTTPDFFVVCEPTGVEGTLFQLNRHHDVKVAAGREAVNAYRFTSRVPAKNALPLIVEAPTVDDPLDKDLFGFEDDLRPIARQWTAPATLPYRKAEKICARLRSSDFTYSLEFNPAPSGKDPILHFLETSRTGECREFAAAATLLLRAEDVPTRLVVGFMSTEFDPANKTFRVRLRDAHAWIEIHLEGYGWITFDPTPPQRLPATTKAIPKPERSGPKPGGAVDPTATVAKRRWDTPIKEYRGREVPWPRVLAVVIGLLLLGSAAALTMRRRVVHAAAQRRAAWRSAPALLPFFNEFLKMLRRHGFAPRRGETIGAFATRLPGRYPRKSLDTLVELYNRARFGSRALGDEAVGRARAALNILRGCF